MSIRYCRASLRGLIGLTLLAAFVVGLPPVSKRAIAADCTPDPSFNQCAPQEVAAEPSPIGGIMVKWIFRIQPLPNSVSIARTVQASIACNQPIGAPVPFNVPAETSFLDDTQAKPGTLYGYSVCANWDSGDRKSVV